MAFTGRYQANSPSTTSLLHPFGRNSASSNSTSSEYSNEIQASLARGPKTIQTMASKSSLNDSPYSGATSDRRVASLAPSIVSLQFSLSADPMAWGTDLSLRAEPDDYLHNPDPRRDRKNDLGGSFFTYRGLTNLGCLILLGVVFVTLFAGYPLISFFTRTHMSTMGGFNLGGINGSGQIPTMSGNYGLIDLETPQEQYTYTSFRDNSTELQLVFSDEFNTDGRSFYPGDDPYWEAVDLHYWETNNLEWYDPAAITTKNGSLLITISRKETHNLHFQGGMMTTWNKFCFTGGLILTSVVLPGVNNVVGLWPAVWTMGNLGRAGYGASLEGMWPYTYDACDVGTAPNQTHNDLPAAATVNGDPSANGALSYLPGQRLSRCTCPGESHPGPIHSDGTYVGRAAPEIDVFEAQANFDEILIGEVSQSGQWAPFNEAYEWFNTSANLIINNPSETLLNSYMGGALQQATSCVSKTNPDCYFSGGGCYSVYGFEYKPGYDDAYISWIANGEQKWTINSGGTAADTRVEISARPIPQEPMYLLVNLGISTNFGDVDFDHLTFPTSMAIDWIRVYQPKDANNIGCDPKDFPTAAYVLFYIEAYTNPNLTTWRNDYKQPFPKSSFLGQC
ncbi:beta-glucan synthesis-associated [Lentinula aff. lateritia]|uniref:Beta-glucan synthesis-associated n=1 Tax=Lentinula aff. lateritia TaxID=2804960 RepID=A0ACC1TNI0_9AGAR|nr:beta-glucan synthesis-associated [Lentinula aff. lateritia]